MELVKLLGIWRRWEWKTPPARFCLVRGEAVEVASGQKRRREGAWGVGRVFPHT